MRKITVLNPEFHREWKEGKYKVRRYLFAFGCVGTTYILVYAYSAEDALEDAAQHLAESGMVGHVVPLDSSPYDLGCDCADPFECESHTYTESGWLTSDEWSLRDNPDNEYLIALAH